jgi:hypothetical protein
LKNKKRKLSKMKLFSVIPQALGKTSSPTFTGLTITGNSVFGLNSSVFQPTTDSTTFLQIKNAAGATFSLFDTTNRRFGVGGAAFTPGYTHSIGSADGSDQIGIFHDNSHAFIQWTVGRLKLITDEGTNTNTLVEILGKGTGVGQLIVYNADNSGFITFNPVGNAGNLQAQGSLTNLSLQANANVLIKMFSSAAEGETQELQIFGRRTGDSRRSLEIGVGVDAADTASFDGLSNYWFNGAIELEFTEPYLTLHNSTHEDSDGGRESRLNFKGEQSGGEETTLARIEIGHDGSADDEKGFIDFYTNDGNDGDSPTKQKRIQNTGDWVINKTSGVGIKVDLAAPTFGFADLLGEPAVKNTGGSRPALIAYRDGLFQFEFAAGEEEYFDYHIPHDYVKGTDIFLHFHWSTNVAVDGGTVTFDYEISYAKAHAQAAFPASVSGTVVSATASTTQYTQELTEVQISASSPSGSQIDTDDLEPDGVIICTAGLNANNLTGGGVPDPFIHYIDIHYQTTGIIGTKKKVPDFYT